MFETLSVFVDDIASFEIPIPIEFQIIFIVIIIIALCVGAYFLRDMFDISTMRGGFSWFIFIAVLNLSTLLAIFIYYNTKEGSYKGDIGKRGKKGTIGKKGNSVSCNFCKNNIYLQKVRQSNVICRLDTKVKAFEPIFKKENYFNRILEKGNSIDYDSFIENIILKNSLSTAKTNTAIDNFNALMNTNSISILLIKVINEISKASLNTYGTFRNPTGKTGYLPIGDSVYGGLEDKLELNSFMIDGNIVYPKNYTQLVSFKSYNGKTGDIDTYTIWRPQGQMINQKRFRNEIEAVHYSALGDLCRYGTTPPKDNEAVTISMDCLEEIDPSDLTLVFVYVGNIDVIDEKKIDYTESNSYLIENEPLNDIEVFSVWRTPMNTFLTNCNSQNELTNNSLFYNIINNLNSALNKYGNISSKAKKEIGVKLEQIQIPKLITALILCKYYEIELLQDIVYYINRYRNAVPEFKSINTSTSTLGDLLNKIDKTRTRYEDFNDELRRKASISLRSNNNKIIRYDEKKEKHLPSMILKVYETAQTKLLTIPVQIENTYTLLDIVNLIFENGLETKVAVDSDGIAQGGVFMNSIQEMVLRICKILMPPNKPAYTVKDESLGTFAIDREREEVIRLFTQVKNINFKLNEKIVNEYEKFEPVMLNVNQRIEIMQTQIGQLCGHIDNYLDKIANSNLEEFTTTRVKGLIEIYNSMNDYLNDVISKV